MYNATVRPTRMNPIRKPKIKPQSLAFEWSSAIRSALVRGEEVEVGVGEEVGREAAWEMLELCLLRKLVCKALRPEADGCAMWQKRTCLMQWWKRSEVAW